MGFFLLSSIVSLQSAQSCSFLTFKKSLFYQITVGRHLIPPLSNFVFSLTFVVQRSLVNVLFSISNSIHDVLTTSLYILYKSRLLNFFDHSFSNVLRRLKYFPFRKEKNTSILSQRHVF